MRCDKCNFAKIKKCTPTANNAQKYPAPVNFWIFWMHQIASRKKGSPSTSNVRGPTGRKKCESRKGRWLHKPIAHGAEGSTFICDRGTSDQWKRAFVLEATVNGWCILNVKSTLHGGEKCRRVCMATFLVEFTHPRPTCCFQGIVSTRSHKGRFANFIKKVFQIELESLWRSGTWERTFALRLLPIQH